MKIQSCPAPLLLPQKEAPAALLQSQRFEKILEHLVDVVCVLDEAGVFQYVSPSSVSLFGYTPHEMTGRSFKQFILPAHLIKTEAAAAKKNDVSFCHYFENHYVRKDDSAVAVSWSGNWDAAEGLFYCVARDGSEQRVLEQRLLKAQQISRTANFEYDVATKTFAYVSDTFFDITGLDQHKHPQLSVDVYWSLVHPEDRAPLFEAFYNAPGKPAKTSHEYRMVQAGGELVYVVHNRELIYDALGRHCRTIGTFQDVTAQKISELALQQREQRLRSLVHHGSDLICIISPEGIYTYVAESVQHLLGYKPAELLGKNVMALMHPDDVCKLAKALAEAPGKQHFQVAPFRFLAGNGQWRWIESNVTNCINDPSVGGLVVNSRDVTEKKINNDKIKQLSLIAQESMHALIITNTQNEIIWVNKTFVAMSEYTEAEVLGKKPFTFFQCPGMLPAEQRRIRRRLASGSHIQTEYFYQSRSGKAYWIYMHIQPLYNEGGELEQFLFIGKDITAQKKAMEELALSEQKFKSLVQQGSDFIAILNSKGCFTYVSDNVKAMLGYNPDELASKSLLSFLHPDDKALVLAGIERVVSNAALKGITHRFLKKDGTYMWLESKGTNLLANPVVQGIIVNARNITDRMALQERLDTELHNKQREITTAVIKAQETERSKLGLELHDNVNQVLTTAKLYNEMFLTGYVADKSLLRKSADYIQDCINEIRSISKRLSAPTLGKITLQDSVGDLIESLNLTQKLQIKFDAVGVNKLLIPEDLHLSIYRIVQEGLNNIIKYADASSAHIHIGFKHSILTIVIADDGKGFNSAIKRPGIGITNMRTRAENMHGTFTLKTAEGEGCIIRAVFDLDMLLQENS